MIVWVTRTAPEAAATAARVEALGHTAIVAPVLEARAIPGATLDLAGIDALAFSSAHAVAAFAALSDARALPVFTVGAATAERARRAGFTHVRSADGGAAALAALIAVAEPRPSLVLHSAARDPAADLVALLAARGVEARALAVYQAVPTGLAGAPAADAILIHSARGAERVAALTAPAARGGLAVYAISPAAAAPLHGLGFAQIVAAPRPNEAALLALLR